MGVGDAARCEALAAALLSMAGRLEGRAGLWVTVVVHERDGVGSACVSTCLTGAERARLAEVLDSFAASLDGADQAGAGSPWGDL
jgi:hypothetical protein